MSCDCRPSTDLCDSCVELLGTGAEQERLRIFLLLEAWEVMRPSMLGSEWRVIYTEHGPKDMHMDTFQGNK
jgi:hypothetical protein